MKYEDTSIPSLVAILLLWLAILLLIRGAEAQEGPSITTDMAFIAGGAVAWEAGCNALNCTEWHEGRTYSLPDPFQAPTNDYGCLPWCEQEVSHYAMWTALGAGMSLKGHDPLTAWLLSGVWGNLVWEYGIESMYTRPSGHDVVINAGSAAVGVALGELAKAVF